MYVTKKNRYFEWCKKVLYAGSESARNILTNLGPQIELLRPASFPTIVTCVCVAVRNFS